METMIRFDNQVAVITGSGRGLGAAYAKLLAERGAAVVVHDAGVRSDGAGTDTEVADAVVHQIRANGGRAVSNYVLLDSRTACIGVINTAIEHFGRIDILIHNAGIVLFTPLEEIDETHLQRMTDIHITAPLWLAQAAFPYMQDNEYGRIVLTTSGRARTVEDATPDLITYAMGKMAQVGLMNGLGAAGAIHNIYVNAISPVAATRMLQRPVPDGTFTAEQVAPAVAYLASSDCQISGLIVRAGNRNFSTTGWRTSEMVQLDEEMLTPEAIAEWMKQQNTD
ncbi:SDR family NAD(P)-dependent oxidoreductase [Chloroflexi bacterium TSY]|nr:SDR family NAD(P)-dependent oxidoreductase [Chloroflexi bacterium TSY]